MVGKFSLITVGLNDQVSMAFICKIFTFIAKFCCCWIRQRVLFIKRDFAFQEFASGDECYPVLNDQRTNKSSLFRVGLKVMMNFCHHCFSLKAACASLHVSPTCFGLGPGFLLPSCFGGGRSYWNDCQKYSKNLLFLCRCLPSALLEIISISVLM